MRGSKPAAVVGARILAVAGWWWWWLWLWAAVVVAASLSSSLVACHVHRVGAAWHGHARRQPARHQHLQQPCRQASARLPGATLAVATPPGATPHACMHTACGTSRQSGLCFLIWVATAGCLMLPDACGTARMRHLTLGRKGQVGRAAEAAKGLAHDGPAPVVVVLSTASQAQAHSKTVCV